MRCMEGLLEERELNRLVTQLSVCGVRPTTIRAVIGPGISLAEITRIFKLATYLTPGERRGRSIRPSNLKRMERAHLLLYSNLMQDVIACTTAGANNADALAAVWRVETARRGLPEFSMIDGACLEDLAILHINLEMGEVGLESCQHCRSFFLALDRYTRTCPTCAGVEPGH